MRFEKHFKLSIIFVLLISFEYVLGQMTVQKGLKISNPIPPNTFVIQTIGDINTVDYGADYDANNGNVGSDGERAHWLRKFSSTNRKEYYLIGTCIATFDEKKEQDIVATCRAVGSAGTLTGGHVRFRLYIDPQTKKPMANFMTQNKAWYGFGSESKKQIFASR